MKYIYMFLCLFLLSGVLSSYSNASEPDYFGDCVRTIRYSYTDIELVLSQCVLSSGAATTS